MAQPAAVQQQIEELNAQITDGMSIEEAEVIQQKIFDLDEGREIQPEPEPEPGIESELKSEPDTEPIEPELEPEIEPEIEPEPEPEPKETVETLTEKLRKTEEAKQQAEQRWRTEQGMIRAQNERIAALEQDAKNFQQISSVLENDPNARSILFNAIGRPQDNQLIQQDFNPDDPASIDQRVEYVLQKRDRQNREAQQQNFLGRINAATQTNRASLIAQGIPEDNINRAVAQLNRDIVDGKAPAIAYKLANIDTLITEAEKRGATNAINKLKTKTTEPKRASSASAGAPSKEGEKQYKDMTREEVDTKLNSLPDNSPEVEKIIKAIDEGKIPLYFK